VTMLEKPGTAFVSFKLFSGWLWQSQITL